MTLEVIGAGYGRTGTMSLKTALDELGFKCQHMTTILKSKDELTNWNQAIYGTPNWDEVFKGYRASVDLVCLFWRDLVQKYPDAKFILTTRDPAKWYQSSYETIYAINRAFNSWFPGVLIQMLPGSRLKKNIIDYNFNVFFEGKFEDKQRAIEIFNKHNEDAKAGIPANRLLVFEVSQGWEPLCKFLGVEVPNKPFPHVNDAAEFKGHIKKMNIIFGTMTAVVMAGLVAGAAVAAQWYFK